MLLNFVEVWHGNVEDLNTDRYDEDYLVLDTHEQTQATKITSDARRKEYVQIHAQLRYKLANIIQQAPDKIVINRTESGKPYLEEFPQIVFNISHTAELFVIAIAPYCQLGVDVEYCKPRLNIAGLVNKCFSSEERTYWSYLSESERINIFYKYWTRKEAFVKATGHGIVLGLNQCVIDSANINRFLSIPEHCGVVTDWFVTELNVSKQHYAALVTDQAGLEVRILSMTSAYIDL